MFKKKIFSRLDKMLDDGINGTFEETDYDESKLSSIESKWYRYLASSKLSENKINIEREKIKELVSDISHQTKTPLTNINLYSQILLEQDLDESSKYLANEIQKQTQKLNFLIQSLVKTSRLETGTFQLNPKKNNLHDLIVRSIEALKIKANNKEITINYVKTNEEAIFDIKWTTEALCNILDNAIKYSDEKNNIYIDSNTGEVAKIEIVSGGEVVKTFDVEMLSVDKAKSDDIFKMDAPLIKSNSIANNKDLRPLINELEVTTEDYSDVEYDPTNGKG